MIDHCSATCGSLTVELRGTDAVSSFGYTFSFLMNLLLVLVFLLDVMTENLKNHQSLNPYKQMPHNKRCVHMINTV